MLKVHASLLGPSSVTSRSKAIPVALAAALVGGVVFAPTDGHARTRAEPQTAKPFSASEPTMIVVSLKRQRLTVFNKDGVVTQSPVSSGTAENPTPTGIFSVLGKEVEHESNIYEGASMPYMQRLTWSGTAMHAGNLPGYPASHGCIRLPYAFSQKLYGLTAINTRVVVTRDDVAPQSFAHANLFKPPVTEPVPADMPMVSAPIAPAKVASLDGVVPPVLVPTQPGLTAKARARFAETVRLFDETKKVEAARQAVWDQVKAANRALEGTKSEINALQSGVDTAQRDVDKAKRAKQSAEAQLAALMRKAEQARTPEALEAFGRAEDVAEAKLVELSDKLDAAVDAVAVLKAGMAPAKEKLQAAEKARRALDDDLKAANLAIKNAQTAYGIAKREDVRYMKPVSVLVNRKTQRLYVRQGFEPVLEVPIAITNPDQPIGTHLYTAMGFKDGTRDLQWTAMSLGGLRQETRRKSVEVDTRGLTPAKALDRIQFPAEAADVINDLMKPGSSLVISDEGSGPHFGNGTDFNVAVR